MCLWYKMLFSNSPMKLHRYKMLLSNSPMKLHRWSSFDVIDFERKLWKPATSSKDKNQVLIRKFSILFISCTPFFFS
nr:hypothetical protein [Tanacetum cinerariifolium]